MDESNLISKCGKSWGEENCRSGELLFQCLSSKHWRTVTRVGQLLYWECLMLVASFYPQENPNKQVIVFIDKESYS